jgi:DNA-binding transcriptional regulator YiaG
MQNAWKSLDFWASDSDRRRFHPPTAANHRAEFERPQPTRDSTVTGPELKQLRKDLGDAIGRAMSAADMAKLCALPPGGGADTIRRWEVSGPSGPAGELLRILAMASDLYPILENFNVFDRFNIPEAERPARRQEFRERMRNEIRERLE